MEKKNDWFASVFLNPDKDTNAFVRAGLTPDNTVMYNKDYYLGIDKVVQKFTDETGKFNEKDFNDYYDSIVRTYNSFVNDSLLGKNIKNEWGMFSIDGDKKIMPKFGIEKVANPERRSQGISSLYGVGEPTRSMKEAAQDNYVRDKNGNKLDWTPNDDDHRGLSFFNNKPLYYAKWESDGTHILPNKEEVTHVKGEYKLDENGLPYLQELGEDEDVSGKELLSITDTLTLDGSTINEYDFLDSDGLDKSITGSVAKMVATIAPVFIPYVGEIYAYGLVAANAADALSSIAKVGIETLDDNYKNNELWRKLNQIEAYTKSTITEKSVSQKGKESFWNLENLSNLVSDVALQGAQQRAVANGGLKIMKWLGFDKSGMDLQKELISKYGDMYVKKYGKSLKQSFVDGDVSEDFLLQYGGAALNHRREVSDAFARNASSLYMALIQSEDIANSMKESNFSAPYTAAATLAAMVGFKKIMDSELGDVALKYMGLNEVSKAVKKNLDTLVKNSKLPETQSGKMLWIKQTSDKLFNSVKSMMDNSEIMESALKEGSEEVTEEFLQDFITGGLSTISWSLKQLGFDDKNQGTWNYLDSNPLERYLSSFVGGAVGGPINRGMDILKNYKAYKQMKIAKGDKQDTLDFIDLVRKYGKDPILKEIEKYEKKNLFPTGLSLEQNSDNNFNPTSNPEESQNHLLFSYLKKYVNYWDNLIHEEGANISDEDLIRSALYKDARAEALKSFGLGSEVITTFNNLLLQLANANLKYKELYNNTKDDQKAFNAELLEVKKTADEIRQKIKDLKDGLFADDFLDKTIFKLNRSLSGSLYTPDIYMYAHSIGKDYLHADEKEKKVIEKNYEEFTKDKEKSADLAYQVYKNARDLMQTDMKSISEVDINYLKDLREGLHDLFVNSKVDGIEEVTNEKLEELIKAKKGTRSDDEIISLNGLNPKGDALTQEEKHQLVLNHLKEEVLRDLDTQSSEAFVRYYQLGLDPEFFGDVERLNKVVQILSELKSKYGYIDKDSLDKAKFIYDKVNNFSATESLTNAIKNLQSPLTLNLKDTTKYSDKIYTDERLKTLLKPLRDKAIENWIAEQGLSEDAQSVLQNAILPEGNDTITIEKVGNEYDVKFKLYSEDYDLEYDAELRFPEAGINEIVAVLNDIFSQKSINSYSDLINTDDDIATLIKESESNTIDIRKNILSQVDSLVNEPSQNDVAHKLVGTISKAVFGEDITELYKEIQKSLSSSNNITDFIIKNPESETKLQILRDSIELMKSVLLYSTRFDEENPNLFNPVTKVNEFRKIKGLDELVTLSEEASNEIFKRVSKIQNAAVLLQELSKLNKGTKLEENKITHSKAIATWAIILSGTSQYTSLSSITLKDVPFFSYDDFDNDILELIRKAYSGAKLNAEELAKLEKALMNLENHYYTKFQNLTDEDKNTIIDKLADLNPFENIPVKLDSKINTKSVDNASLAGYLISIMSNNSEEFKQRYRDSLKEEEFKDIVPLYSQMFAVKEAVSFINNPEILNTYLKKLAEKHPKENGFFLGNQVYIPGPGGSGKTKVIARLLVNIIRKQNSDIPIISYAWKKDRADELHSIIKSSKSYHEYNIYERWFKDEAIELIKDFKNSIKDSISLDIEKLTETLNKILAKATPPSKKEVIVIDEYTHLSNFELKLLGSINNVFLVNLGDPTQNGFKGGGGVGGTGISMSTPALGICVRANNNLKKDNLNRLSGIIDVLRTQTQKYKIGQGGVADTKSAIDMLKQSGFLKYSENNGLIKGEKLVNSIEPSEIENMINKLPDGEKIAYIYSKDVKPEISNLVNKYSDKFIVVRDVDVQGSEYDYTIIDINYNNINDDMNTPADVAAIFKNIYTVISRSKSGSIIVKNNNCPISESKAFTSYSEDTLSADEITEYKNFINDVYDKLDLAETAPATPTETPAQEMAPDIKLNTTSGEKTLEKFKSDVKPSKDSFTVYPSYVLYNFNSGNSLLNMGHFNSNDSESIEQYNILKNLIFRKKEEIKEIVNRTDFDYIIKLVNECIIIARKVFPNDSDETIKNNIINSSYYIKKVAYNDSLKSESGKWKPATDLYIIYKKIGDWEIDLGVITDPNNLEDSDTKNNLISMDYNNAVQIDESKMKIKYAKARISESTDLNYSNNSIPKFRDNNPWASVGGTVWVANREATNSNVQIGYPFVLYSRDLFIPPVQFKSYFESGVNGEDNTVIPLRVSFHGQDFKGYMSKWASLFKSKDNKIRFSSFSGYMQPVYLRRQILRFQRFLNLYIDHKQDIDGGDLESLKTGMENLYQVFSKKGINNSHLDFDIAQYRSILNGKTLEELKKLQEDVTAFVNKLGDDVAKYKNTFGYDWDTVNSTLFTEETKRILPKVNILKFLRSIQNKTEDIEAKLKEAGVTNVTSKMVNNVNDNVNRFLSAYDEFIKIHDNLQNPFNAYILDPHDKFTEWTDALLDWMINKGLIGRFFGGTMLTHTLFDAVKDDKYMKIAELAINGTAQYKDGIWTNGIVSDMAQNGFYISNNKDSDLYFNSLIEQPDVYINLDSIMFDKSQSTTSVTPSNIEAPQITLSDYLKDITLPNGISRENLEKAISDKLTDITLTENNIKSVLENKFVIVQTDTGPQPVFIHYEADKINATYIVNNNIADFGEKIVPKLTAINEAIKDDFIADSNSGSTVDVSVTNDGIQINFGNSIYLINSDELKKTEVESKSVVSNDIDIEKYLKTKLGEDVVNNNLVQLITKAFELTKDKEQIETKDINAAIAQANSKILNVEETSNYEQEYGISIKKLRKVLNDLWKDINENNICLS